ncbi:flavin reductase family protein [Psychrobacillus sp. NPDC096426]|uniref:flavin reductase family protein n=1 Tax=Psychrobacillus sp. NPDC096426 TaxID=3364491 RepID=UPI00380D2DCD
MQVKNKEVSEQLFKEVMGSYPSGVTVITTVDQENNPFGLTANSFISVSIDPLLVLWCIDKRANSYSAFGPSDKFAVNILAAEQAEACWTFSSKKEEDRFGKHDWTLSENGLPILTGSFATLQCKKVQEVDAGDHYILIGEVIGIEKSEQDPMLYFRRNVGAVPAAFGQL